MCLQLISSSPAEKFEQAHGFSLLHLPELALENILSRLPAESLCVMAGLSCELRNQCQSNHLWEPLLKAKWGKIVGVDAYREWQWNVAFDKVDYRCCIFWTCIWPFSLLHSDENGKKKRDDLPLDSLMARYCALESGQFWFPAQVYNREHGHVGFMLSCYDAHLSYDRRTDTFRARYPPHGPHMIAIEEDVEWGRLRATPVDTPAHALYTSTCLANLKPGDHAEVQWRRNKEFPYGWWYAVVGHLDVCDGDSHRCICHLDDTLCLDFNQYTIGSRWRRRVVNRHTHHEVGNEADGFYGGIRKLQTAEEISAWKQLWPDQVLE